MKKLIAIALSLCASLLSFSQESTVRYDFDGDGKIDKFQVLENTSGTYLQATLSKHGSEHSNFFTYMGSSHEIKIQKNVVVLTVLHNSWTETLKFRFDKTLKSMRLIGYDTRRNGNAAGDGSGYSSFNLLTGEEEEQDNFYNERLRKLEKGKIERRKGRPKFYTVENFGEYVGWE